MTVVERRESFTETVETQPAEAAWASEAIFYVRVEAIEPGSSLTLAVQLSADGLRWVDEGTVLKGLDEPGDHFARVRHFGGWLRLAGRIDGSDPTATLTVQLALKE